MKSCFSSQWNTHQSIKVNSLPNLVYIRVLIIVNKMIGHKLAIAIIILWYHYGILLGYRKILLKELHNFAHLNLAVALFLALTVFAVGIETATSNKVNCYANNQLIACRIIAS